jgi:hypothetical protein
MTNGAGSGAALRKIAESVSGPVGPTPIRNTRNVYPVLKITGSNPPRDSVGVLFYLSQGAKSHFQNFSNAFYNAKLKESQTPTGSGCRGSGMFIPDLIFSIPDP